MTVLGGDTLIKLTELVRHPSKIIKRLQAGKDEPSTRVIVTERGEPALVVQDYKAYTKMRDRLEKLEDEHHLSILKVRLAQPNRHIPFDEFAARVTGNVSD